MNKADNIARNINAMLKEEPEVSAIVSVMDKDAATTQFHLRDGMRKTPEQATRMASWLEDHIVSIYKMLMDAGHPPDDILTLGYDIAMKALGERANDMEKVKNTTWEWK